MTSKHISYIAVKMLRDTVRLETVILQKNFSVIVNVSLK